MFRIVLTLIFLTTIAWADVEVSTAAGTPEEELKDMVVVGMQSIVSLNQLVTELTTRLLQLTLTVNDMDDRVKDLKWSVKEETAVLESLKDQVDSANEALTEVSSLRDQVASAGEAVEASKTDSAWQALHMAAAAACRGSTASGGAGPSGNAVIPKENTRSCDDICGATAYNVCDADVSLIGRPGKAADYTNPIGYFYNYGCGTPGNTDVNFDEVKAEEGRIRAENVTYYRFCCCRKA